MPYHDIREYLTALENRGLLQRVTKTVDPGWEPACIARWLYQGLPEQRRFGLLFESVSGYDMPLMVGVLGASTATYATALETTPEGINERWVEAVRHPREPVTVTSALCQEVVRTGEDADLGILPVPVWTPGKDAAPYITNVTIARDADFGHQNTAIYRTMILDRRHVAVNLNPGRHGMRCASSYWRQGKPAPIAWALGAEPVVPLAAVANVPYGVDELTIAGGLKRDPIEVVRAKSVDLMVPANAEIIIEAELRPGETADEGPFGEFAGYMGPVAAKPVATITAITHRRDPIYHGIISQMPPSESTTIQSLGNAGLLLKTLRHDLGHESVADVYIDLTFGGLLAHGIIAMKPMYPGHAKQIGRLVADLTFLKRVTVVDADVDIRDPLHVDWALNSRYSPARDTIIVEDVFTPVNMDPAITDPTMPVAGSKIIIDATEAPGVPEFSLPDRDFMRRSLQAWNEAGLPPFEIPKRMRLMLSLDEDEGNS
jgi:UbiD family decarboxylase